MEFHQTLQRYSYLQDKGRGASPIKVISLKMAFYRVCAYVMIVHAWSDQLLPKLLMEPFDILPSQYRHIEHMHEGDGLKKHF